MFSRILKSIVDFFTEDPTQYNLDAYIRARNPQDASDVERLEREFQEKQSRQWIFLNPNR